jgi:hypothetical protein
MSKKNKKYITKTIKRVVNVHVSEIKKKFLIPVDLSESYTEYLKDTPPIRMMELLDTAIAAGNLENIRVNAPHLQDSFVDYFSKMTTKGLGLSADALFAKEMYEAPHDVYHNASRWAEGVTGMNIPGASNLIGDCIVNHQDGPKVIPSSHVPEHLRGDGTSKYGDLWGQDMTAMADFILCMAPICPECKKKMLPRQNKTTTEWFWGCRDFPRCTGMLLLSNLQTQ